MKPLFMQDHRVFIHGNKTEQQSDLEHRASMQQQCVRSLMKDLGHHGQEEGCLQHSALGEQPSTPSRLQLSPGSLLQGVNQHISAESKDLQGSSLQEDLLSSGCLDPTNLQLEDPHSGLQSRPNQQIPAEGKDLHCSGSQQKALYCSGNQDPTNLEPEEPHGGVQNRLNDWHCSGSQQKDFYCSGNQDPTNLEGEEPHDGVQNRLNDLQVSRLQKALYCSGNQDPTNLEEEPHGGVQNQLNDFQVSHSQNDLYCSGNQDPKNLEPEDPHDGVQNQRNDLQVSSLQKYLYCFGSQDPANLEPEDPHGELQSPLNQHVSAEAKDLHCLSCQDSTNLEPQYPHGELQGQLSRLHLGEANVHLGKRQRSQERESYQPFHHHDVKGHFTDIRYPEPLSTEESPRRRARSLPWNSIPEEEEEDSVMCCCKLKKRVKFADSLGLTLASIKHFLPSDEPLVPQAVLARLQSYPPIARGQRSDLILEDEFTRAELAPSEGTPAELLEKLNEQGVCLEQVSASRLGVLGYVLVKDSEEKAQVKIRYTFNEWLSFLDCPATPTSRSTALPSSSGCQRFHFNLCYPPSTSCIRFAICFNSGNGQEMWDNNKGDNYTVNCQRDVIPEIQESSPDQEEWEGSRLW